MVTYNVSNCPICGGVLKYYDKVGRIIRTKGGIKRNIKLKRFRCLDCKRLHRALPSFVVPYKQYEAEVIKGVLEGFITPETIGFEDYPCEKTIARWCAKLTSSLMKKGRY